jgi:hypothetical protein
MALGTQHAPQPLQYPQLVVYKKYAPHGMLLPSFVFIGKCQAPHKVYSPAFGPNQKQILLPQDGIRMTCHPEPLSEFGIRLLLTHKAAEYNEPF